MISHEEVAAEPAIASLLSKGYSIATIHRYLSSVGEELFCRVRLEHPAKGKEIRPVYRAAGDVVEVGEPESLKTGLKPLYGLPALAANPNAHVWVVEGEKCADRLNDFFEQAKMAAEQVAITSGGSSSADKADWSPLNGREVTIWPDNDESGLEYADKTAQALAGIAKMTITVDSAAIGVAEKHDCVDWLASSPTATLADLIALPKLKQILPPDEMEVICMSDVIMRPVEWLWPQRIACGKLTVIAGHPGLGKSQITANLSATVTTGRGWPETLDPAPMGSVLFLSAEDEADDTIKPRLVAAGADVSKCHVINAVNVAEGGKSKQRSFDLVQDVERLGRAFTKIGDVRLIVIDPISAYLGKVDGNDNAQIRGALKPLSDLASQHGVTVLLVTHLNKAIGMDYISRISGSGGMIAAARAGYIVIQDEADAALRYFLPIKNNLGDDRTGFGFHIEPVVVDSIPTSRIVWRAGLVEARAILYPKPDSASGSSNPAVGFLKGLLSGGSMIASEVFQKAEEELFTERNMRTAAKKLGVQVRKKGMKGGFEWTLPNAARQREDAEDCENTDATMKATEPEPQPS